MAGTRGWRTVRDGWWRAAVLAPAAVLTGLVSIGALHAAHAVVLGLALLPIIYLFWQNRRDHAVVPIKSEVSGQAVPSLLSNYAQSVIDVIPDALVLLDSGRRVIEANSAARELFGLRLTGRDFTQVLRHPSAIEAMDRVLASSNVSREEITLLSPGERHFVLTALPMTSGEGSEDPAAPAMAIALHEVTALKRSEQLRADFVANASHELRTPLASLIGFIETLQGPAKDDPVAQERFLEIMSLESARMARLINDLLSLSRIELDEHVVPSDSIDIVGIVENVVEVLSLVAADRGMSIAVEIETALPRVLGDADQLTQVFQNLIDNAIKYGRTGTIVRITGKSVARLPETGGPGVAIKVINEGEGIAREHLPRLTDRFYRVDPARSRQKGGTGLGLAIVKHIVNRHRGRLVFESELGVGTTVTVYLRAKVDGGEGK
ncbi:ATP-binding protein [Iodidimonas sp. SYSU 1G8]|uniref:ATP-binding protein n=1 Tax=Iodidimonas sp. SYSU 1G8 TaxID=3133967 RepID=UPI0031FEC87F